MKSICLTCLALWETKLDIVTYQKDLDLAKKEEGRMASRLAVVSNPVKAYLTHSCRLAMAEKDLEKQRKRSVNPQLELTKVQSQWASFVWNRITKSLTYILF